MAREASLHISRATWPHSTVWEGVGWKEIWKKIHKNWGACNRQTANHQFVNVYPQEVQQEVPETWSITTHMNR